MKNSFKRKVQKVRTLALIRKLYRKDGYDSILLLDECVSQVLWEINSKYHKTAKKFTRNEEDDSSKNI